MIGIVELVSEEIVRGSGHLELLSQCDAINTIVAFDAVGANCLRKPNDNLATLATTAN